MWKPVKTLVGSFNQEKAQGPFPWLWNLRDWSLRALVRTQEIHCDAPGRRGSWMAKHLSHFYYNNANRLSWRKTFWMHVRHGDKLNQLKIHSTTPLPRCTFDLILGPGEFAGNLQSPESWSRSWGTNEWDDLGRSADDVMMVPREIELVILLLHIVSPLMGWNMEQCLRE